MTTKTKAKALEGKDWVIIPEGELNFPDGEGGRQVRWGGSWVIAYTGIRGSGKSLSMALCIAHALVAGCSVWSNMNVHFKYKLNDGQYRTYQTKPLDWDAVYTLSGDLKGGVVAIDELQYFLDSRQSLTVRSRLLNAVLYQIRKRSLDFIFTVKDIEWLDKRLRAYELDIEVKCWDNHMTNSEIRKGHSFRWTCYDHSGAWTGHPYNPKYPWTCQPACEYELHKCDRFWGIYDTEEIIDYFETFNPLKVEMEQKTIGDKANKNRESLEALFQLSSRLLTEGYNVIPTDEMYVMAKKQNGANINVNSMGKLLVRMGVVRKRSRQSGTSSVYDLTELFIPDELAGKYTQGA